MINVFVCNSLLVLWKCVPSIGCMNIKITLEDVKVSVDVKVKVKVK